MVVRQGGSSGLRLQVQSSGALGCLRTPLANRGGKEVSLALPVGSETEEDILPLVVNWVGLEQENMGAAAV